MKITLSDLELKMWSITTMPEPLKGTDGKWQKDSNGKTLTTGKMIEYTTYIFRDLLGEKLELMSAKNQYRDLEGKNVDLIINLTKSTFNGKSEIKINLDSVVAKKNK